MERLDLLVEKQAEVDELQRRLDLADYDTLARLDWFSRRDAVQQGLLRRAERLLVDYVQTRDRDITKVTSFLVELREHLGPADEPERTAG